MTETSKELADERIESMLPLQVGPSGWQTHLWILPRVLLLIWIVASVGPHALAYIASFLLVAWVVTKVAMSKSRAVSDAHVVVMTHAFRFGSDRRTIPYSEVRKIEMYTDSSVWMYLHDGEEHCFSIAGLPKEDRPLLVAWLQRRLGADVPPGARKSMSVRVIESVQ